MAEQHATATTEWKTHWPLAAAATAGLTFPATATYSLGLFMEPLTKEFGWSRSVVTSGLIVLSLMMIPFASPAGALVDRFGARRIAIPGTLVAMTAIASFSFANGSVVQWMALWITFAVATLLTKPTVWTAAVSKAFSASRGLALGVVLCATSISQSLTPIITERLIENYGWRHAYQLLAAGWGGLVFVIVLFFFHDAYGNGARPRIGLKSDAGPLNLPGYIFSQAIRTRPVLQICGAVLINALVTTAVSINLVPILGETGLSRVQAAGFAGIAGVAGITGKLLTGVLLDRFRGNIIPFTSMALPAVGMFILFERVTSPPMVGLSVLALGYAAGASMQSAAYLVTRFAGMRSFGAVYGILAAIMGMALGTGPWCASRIFDVTGSYHLVLMIGVPGSILAGLLMVGLGPYPTFAKADEDVAPAVPSGSRPFPLYERTDGVSRNAELP